MTDYRNDANEFVKEGLWSFFKILPLFLIVVVVLFAVGFGLKSLGLIGGTIVEREVFEQSYQRTAAIKAKIATDKAIIAEIERKLSNLSLDENTRINLEAQMSAARVRIAIARGNQ